MLPKPPNKYFINIVIKCYEPMMNLGYFFHLASASENSVQTVLKATQVSKVTGTEKLSEFFLKDGAKFLSKFIIDLFNLSITH